MVSDGNDVARGLLAGLRDSPSPSDPIARLHEIALELRCIAREAQASADRITAALAISESGIGCTDKSEPCPGFVTVFDARDDGDPESGAHP